MKVNLAPWQIASIYSPFDHFAMIGGVACVRGSTLVETIGGPVRMDRLQKDTMVWAMDDRGLCLAACKAPFVKGRERLYRVVHKEGEFVCHALHLILCSDGRYRHVKELCVGDELISFSSTQLRSNSESFQKSLLLNGQHYSKTLEGSQFDYPTSVHLYDRQPRHLIAAYGQHTQLGNDELKSSHFFDIGHLELELKDTHLYQSKLRHANKDFLHHSVVQVPFVVNSLKAQLSEQTSRATQFPLQFQKSSECRSLNAGSLVDHTFCSPCSISYTSILSISRLEEEEEYWDIQVPGPNNYLAEGVVHHNCGKTYSGSHYAIRMIREHPNVTGFIGANTYDQLTQATLRELFYWFDQYGVEYVIDQIPPSSWSQPRRFKSYKNILSVRQKTGEVTTVFIRVLSEPNAIRGIEFTWYWIDESRDTPLNTHDVILSRMRESNWQKGLVTTTPAGEDWVYKRFVRNKDNSKTFGSMHVRTIEAVHLGIISQAYYDTMLKSYSPVMAEQELNAQHVNVASGRAYYAASELNRRRESPWGTKYPTLDRPLVVGCDFNFSPAPCIWVVGQIGEDRNGRPCIHWFREVRDTEVSSAEMTGKLLNQFPGFFYRIFGDASGTRGSTSNQGVTDVIQINETMSSNGAAFSIDFDHANPRVRDRVENTNRCLLNALGEVTMTYDPEGCPDLDGDMRVVGWRQPKTGATTYIGGRLDNCGDVQRTHASDGVGYALWKLFPPAGRVNIVPAIQRAHADLSERL